MNKIPVIKWPDPETDEVLTAFFERPAFDAKAERTATAVLKDIRANGDKALFEYSK